MTNGDCRLRTTDSAVDRQSAIVNPQSSIHPVRFLGAPAVVWALVILFFFWMFFQIGVPFITKWVTGKETAILTIDLIFTQMKFKDVSVGAPIPASLMKMYMGMAAMAILLYISITEESLKRFFTPVRNLLVAQSPKPLVMFKYVCMAGVPFLVALLVYDAKGFHMEPPVELRTIHPTLPGKYLDMSNPFPWTPENIKRGRDLYVANCSWCHGDRADGDGLFAGGFNPAPIDFSAAGTIDMLPENYLFWRIKEGGVGLPNESWPWASAMPPWNPSGKPMGLDIPAEHRMSDEDIWLVIMGAYDVAGRKPAKRD